MPSETPLALLTCVSVPVSYFFCITQRFHARASSEIPRLRDVCKRTFGQHCRCLYCCASCHCLSGIRDENRLPVQISAALLVCL